MPYLLKYICFYFCHGGIQFMPVYLSVCYHDYANTTGQIFRQNKQSVPHEGALCQLTVCFEIQSTSKSRKGHNGCTLQILFTS